MNNIHIYSKKKSSYSTPKPGLCGRFLSPNSKPAYAGLDFLCQKMLNLVQSDIKYSSFEDFPQGRHPVENRDPEVAKPLKKNSRSRFHPYPFGTRQFRPGCTAL
jgi:hypothetical protein